MFEEQDEMQQFREAWEACEIARPVTYSLFTFGESVLPYFLVTGKPQEAQSVYVTKGEVHINRPMIITPNSARPEFRNFFEDVEQEGFVQFLLARTARFSNLKFENQSETRRAVDDGMEAAVAKLNQRLDDEEEDHVAILTSPPKLGKVAIFRYATERVLESGPDNIQELRERGFLP